MCSSDLLRLNNTAHQLNSAGGYHSIRQIANEAPYIGYGGVLIVNNIVGDGRTYHAFDLACPVENKQTVRITMNDDFTAECKECGSKFGQVMYGNPIPTDGTAAQRKLKLRQYFNIGYDSNNNTLTMCGFIDLRKLMILILGLFYNSPKII